MEPILGKWAGPIYVLMRIVAGFLFACYGAQRLFAVFGGSGGAHGRFLAAGIIEIVCGPLILVGLFTSYAALVAAGEMAAANVWIHMQSESFQILGNGERAALYFVIFLFIAARGSGSFSLDRALGRGGSKA
jgi:putative oxidoreductase